MTVSDMAQLAGLAGLVRSKNQADAQVAGFIGRPAITGHFGEFVAANLFGIALHDSAVEKGSDGRFVGGPLAGRSVEIKYYPKLEGILDIKVDGAPDYYLVLTGPRSGAASSRGMTLPWVIEGAYLFETASLVSRLTAKAGVATSVRREFWQEAEIYPRANPVFPLSPQQCEALRQFSEASIGGAC